MMKVLFVAPNSHSKYATHPLGLVKLASMIRNDHEVRIYDMDAFNATLNDLKSTIDTFNPDVVGVTARTSNLSKVTSICKTVKETTKARLIIGGADPTARPLQSIVDTGADIAVLGEGEATIREVVEATDRELFKVKGLVIKTKNSLVETEPRPLIENLDSLPFASFDLLDLKKYMPYPLNLPPDYLGMCTSRGCPWNCLYCFKAIFGRSWRANSAKYVVDEIEFYINTLPIHLQSFIFFDDTFTVSHKRVYEMCDLIKKRHIDMTARFETRVNLINEQLLTKMYDSGFKHVSFGVESGNPDILLELQKGITIDQIRTAFKTAHKIGFTTTAYMFIGSPSETPETIRDSIDLAKDLNADFTQWSIASPLPSTQLYDWYVKNYGAITDWNGLCYSELFSVDRGNSSVYRSKYMTNRELNIWMKKAYKETYIHWKYILKRIWRSRSPLEFKANLLGLKELLNIV